MLQFVHIAVGTGNGLACARCTAAPGPTYAPAAELVERIRAAAEGWPSGPGPNIILGGPEPFAHPQLPALVAACVEHGVQRICLETDAGALSVPTNAEGVLQAGVRHIHMRMLAAQPVLGDDLTGKRGRTADALAGIDAFLAAAESARLRVAITVVIPVCEHNLASLSATVAALAGHSIDAVRLTPAGPLPNGAGAVLAAACDTGMVNQLWVEAEPTLPLPETHALHVVGGEVRDG